MRTIITILIFSLFICILNPALCSPVVPQADTSFNENKISIYFFRGEGCPHCKNEERFLEVMKAEYPQLEINSYEVWYNEANREFLQKMTTAAGIKLTGVPVTFIDKKVFVGFSENIGQEINGIIRYCMGNPCISPLDILNKKPDQKEEQTISLPFLGRLDTSKISLPLMTIILGGLDSFNPCAFFVLFFLLSLLIYTRSRKKMLLIGGIFIFFSGLIYFLFMAAWLNFFILAGNIVIITAIAGIIALAVAGINIKDYFFFSKGVSLSIPEDAKPKLFERMRNLIKSTSIPSMIAGTVVLAIAANTYELLCTAGFPMVFTRILTLHKLTSAQYYLYLLLYNIIYVIPLFIIVLIFSVTLGAKKLTEWQGRKLKLLSGLMMLLLGLVLIIKPALLNNVFVAFGLLASVLVIFTAIIFLTRRYLPNIINGGKD